MIWYYALDEYYYSIEYRKKLIIKHITDLVNNIDEQNIDLEDNLYVKILVTPSLDDIKRALISGKRIVVISPQLPYREVEGMFVLKVLPDKYGIFTTQEYMEIASIQNEQERIAFEKNIIERKLGLRIYKPRMKEEDVIGMTNIKRYIYSAKNIDDPLLKPRGIMLVGVPGTGKSYSAKYAASLLDASLVELNISSLLEKPDPILTLHDVFGYLQHMSKQGEKFVLWIDEIEKMFVEQKGTEKRLFGQLLTILNDLNSDTGYHINGIFWVTANSISDIMNNNPEFLRRGRFDELFFVDNPTISDAKKIVKLYQKYYKLDYGLDRNGVFVKDEDIKDSTATNLSLSEEIIYNTSLVYRKELGSRGHRDANRFIYVPSEIQHIVKSLAIRKLIKKGYLSDQNNRAEIMFPESVRKRLTEIGITDSSRIDYFVDLDKQLFQEMKKDIRLKSVLAGKDFDDELNTLDVQCVLSQIEPISISMVEALSKIRSNENLFMKAD